MNNRKAYSDHEHELLAGAYVAMAIYQLTGRKYSKAEIVRGLMAVTGRTRGAIEAKFMNLSAAAVKGGILPALPGGYVKGYKPAPNGAKCLESFLLVALFKSGPVGHVAAGRPVGIAA